MQSERQSVFQSAQPILLFILLTFPYSANILALSWLHHTPDRFVAGGSNGAAAMYKITDTSRMDDEETEIIDSSALELHYTYPTALTSEMTSLHCNADDTLLCASGYTHSVNILDLGTGQRLRQLKNIHQGHINIARFANGLPYLLLTCSFDRKLNMFDTRSNARVVRAGMDPYDSSSWLNRSSTPVPIYTCSTQTGCVMVCFSPNDMYFLSSAVDNEVKQWSVVDGSLDLEYAIPKLDNKTNYTRSYYMNEGETIISGSSGSDLLHICSSVDGQVLDSVDMSEGRHDSSLYIQSLRGCPDHHNRASVLVCYRKQPIEKSFELIEVNLNVNTDSQPREHPLSLASIIHMADDYKQFMNHPYAADVVISCQGATGSNLIYAHDGILRARWPWYAKYAVWNSEAGSPLSSSSSIAANGVPPIQPPAVDSGSLDEDDEAEESVHMTDATTAPVSNGSQQAILYCTSFFQHPSSSTFVRSSPSSSRSDKITISSNGMISIEFSSISHFHMLCLLEYLYTSVTPIQTEAFARSNSSRHQTLTEAKRLADLSQARHQRNYEYIDEMRRAEEQQAAESAKVGPSSTVANSSTNPNVGEFRSLDDDSPDGSLRFPFTCNGNGVAGKSDTGASVHEELVRMSEQARNGNVHAPTPGMTLPSSAASSASPSSKPSIPPLSYGFEDKATLFELASPNWYQLPRLANILERSMRHQITLTRTTVDEEIDPATYEGSTSNAIFQKPSSSSSSSASTSSPSSPPPAILTFARRIEACLRIGAVGLVRTALDLIERSYDWLEVNHPTFLTGLEQILAQLPSATAPGPSTSCLFSPPVSFSSAMSSMRTRRRACLNTDLPLTIYLGSFPVLDYNDSQLVLWVGGYTMKQVLPFGSLNMLRCDTLQSSSIACHFESPRSNPEDGLTSYASCIVDSSGTGRPSHLLVYGGQTTTQLLQSTLFALDLSSLTWSEVTFGPTKLPRARKKHTLTNVPSARRCYIFAGRDEMHCLADLFYIDYSDPTKPWQLVNVTEMHRLAGRTNVTRPSGRYGHTCVYSPSIDAIVLFGGADPMGGTNDVWLLDPSTSAWRCVIPNEPSSNEIYEARLQQRQERRPVPRLGHSACLVTCDGQECMAIFGGVSIFDDQIVHNDLWLLDLVDFTWRKMPYDARTPPFILSHDASVNEERVRDEVPSRRWEHTIFLKPYDRSDSSSHRASGQLVVLGGTIGANMTPWIDVFDFDTLKWSRQHSHPSCQEPQPTINICEDGCLWLDMQQRFRRTQPEPFTQPIVDTVDPTTLSPAPNVGPITTATLDEAIEYNLCYERAFYSRPTPLPSSSFIHFLVEGRILTVPKIVLVSRVPTFLSMLTSTIRDPQLDQRNLIVVEGVRYIIFRCILYFIYCGDEEFVVEIKNHAHRLLHPSLVHPLRSGSSTRSSSPSSSSSSSSRGIKRVASRDDDISDSEELLSLGRLEMTEMERAVSSGSKKCKNGHTPSQLGTPLPIMNPPWEASDIPSVTSSSSSAAFSDPFTSSSTIAVSPCVVDPLEIQVAADRFNLASLCAVLEIGLARQIEVNNVAKFLCFAETYHLNVLKERCLIFIIQHYETVTASVKRQHSIVELFVTPVCSSHSPMRFFFFPIL